jgi:uncharacterized membrane protein YidH (DUF202 family)
MAFEDGAFPFAPSSTKLPAGLEFLQGSHASSTNAAWLRTTLDFTLSSCAVKKIELGRDEQGDSTTVQIRTSVCFLAGAVICQSRANDLTIRYHGYEQEPSLQATSIDANLLFYPQTT